MTTATKRILPPDVYDALELSAEAFGGIGAGQYFDYICGVRQAPRCVIGHFAWVCDAETVVDSGVESEMRGRGITIDVNDEAVAAINQRAGHREHTERVPFADWCAELNVERGV